MRLTLLLLVVTAAFAAVGVMPASAAEHARVAAMGVGAPLAAETRIPGSIQAEHDAIHAALVESTRLPGRVGVAARALAEVLHPHFVREEQIALPPLGLLAPLAAGRPVDDANDVLVMTDALRRELPRMLEEHGRIRAAVEGLRLAAEAEGAPAQVRLAETLAQHALTEEDVLYPAAILVGDLLRARKAAR